MFWKEYIDVLKWICVAIGPVIGPFLQRASHVVLSQLLALSSMV